MRDLAAQGGYLDGQGGQALAERLRGRFSLRAGHRPPRPGRGEGQVGELAQFLGDVGAPGAGLQACERRELGGDPPGS